MSDATPVELKAFDRVTLLSRTDYNFDEPVHIAGAVRKAGEFVWHPALTVKNLVDLAGGPTIGARTDRVEISRILIKEGISDISHLTVDLADQQNFILQPYDYVLVPRVKDATRVATVTLSGEVRYPGTYSIADGEYLSDVIRRAGGFTDNAYFYGASFTSLQAQKVQQQSIDKMVQTLELTAQRNIAKMEQLAAAEDSAAEAQVSQITAQKLIKELAAVKASGRISMRLAPLSELTGSVFDVELQEGDHLHIPPKPAFVSVVGSVYSPNSYLFQPGLTVADYLELSGGPTKDADEDYIYVQRANGEVLSAKQSGMFSRFYSQELMPGDAVVVLEDLERLPVMRVFKDVTEIVFRIVTTAGIFFAI
ncbi:MAG: SLBB domain-containing protein [Deltaproteobacteria bacterium]|nr:SLBB domain-containing protein [Candidatus Anaeroferrophillus wilburensis]MBN2888892.1 SLBB domain-containing protein [Deltaproteobacteria bacterium]